MQVSIGPNGKKTRLPTETELGIYGFFADYRFLSNFHYCNNGVRILGLIFPTSEHAYMAMKSLHPTVHITISRLPTPMEARNYGKTILLREDWNHFRVLAMTEVLLAKFTQNPDLKEKLLRTGDKYLEETNDWGDTFWGVCNDKGEGMLGKCLMGVRSYLRDNT